MIGGAARGLVRAAQRLVPAAPSGSRILCYHLIGGGTDSPVDVPLRDFCRQLEAVAASSETVDLQGALNASESDEAGTRCRTVISFDDAYRNFLENAWPVLLERRIPTILFVPTGFLNRTHPGPLTGAEGLAPLAWADLRQMLDTGLLTVGAHTRSHPDVRGLSGKQLQAELVEPRRELEDRLGVAVEAFCYPRGLWNRRVEIEVARAYRLAVVGGGRRVRPERTSPYRLPRTSVRRDPALPVSRWLRQPIWLEEAVADVVRRAR